MGWQCRKSSPQIHLKVGTEIKCELQFALSCWHMLVGPKPFAFGLELNFQLFESWTDGRRMVLVVNSKKL